MRAFRFVLSLLGAIALGLAVVCMAMPKTMLPGNDAGASFVAAVLLISAWGMLVGGGAK